MNIYKLIVKCLFYFSILFFVLETIIPVSWAIWIKNHMIYIIPLFIAFMEFVGERIIYMIAYLLGKDIDGSKNYKGKHNK